MIQKYFRDKNRVALAFSGGADSAFLLSVAKECGCDIRPYYIKTQFQTRHETNNARCLADVIGVPLKILSFDVFSVPNIIQNEADRCYHCKYAFFRLIQSAAAADGCEMIIDGTNASDDVENRPGMQALSELGVSSPLRESGLSKSQIRELSQHAGLSTWNKPSNSCLATRIPTGTPINKETLRKVERAETYLFELGFSDFRVRIFHDVARIQLLGTQFDRINALRFDVLSYFSQYFDEVFLDLECRN